MLGPALAIELKKRRPARRLWAIALVSSAICVSTAPRGAEFAVKFVDVAAKAGVTLLNICGDVSKDFIVDANGSGVAWLDFDNDGNLDLLVVTAHRGITSGRAAIRWSRSIAMTAKDTLKT